MKLRDKKWIRFRIYLVAGFFFIGTGIILARAYQLQVIQGDKLDGIARSSYKDKITLPPERGVIYDRGGRELAVSVEVCSIYAHPSLVKDKNLTAIKLAQKLDVRSSSMLALLKKDRSFVWIKRRISPEKGDQIKSLGLKGIGLAPETRRYYPGREIASNLLGFAGADNQGLEGLEKKYDEILKGPQHTLVQMSDALGRSFYISQPEDNERNVHNLVLTVDMDIQYKAQKALEAAVEKFQGNNGQCLIMNPDTGEILAMAVTPSFNPNSFGNYQPYQWRNRIITDCYEPGSIIKTFLIASALEENLISSNTYFYCEKGSFRIANRTIHDTKKYENLTVADILVLSSNIGAVKIGQILGYDKFYEYLNRFGFGSRTGVELIGERQGYVRPVKEAKEIDQANSYFGQGMSATSLQLATAMAAVANGGRIMRPYVVKTVTDQHGKAIENTRPTMVRRVISPETASLTTKIMEGVVSDRGTAPLAAIPGFSVVGKTGTSQKVDSETKTYSKKDYVAIFAGFVPKDNPKLVMVVMIDEPKGQVYGGLVSAPVFREVGSWVLNNLQIHPELRQAYQEEGMQIDSAKARVVKSGYENKIASPGLLPDFRGKGMRAVIKSANELGLKVVLKGSGLAERQTPGPGSPLGEISAVEVIFTPPT
jgi:cell division protein FtsI (penicillin-binding protein 3)